MSSNVDYLRVLFDETGAATPEAEAAWESFERQVSDDFQFLNKDGDVIMDKARYLGFMRLLSASFKDMKYVYSGFTEEGDYVTVRAHWEGTFTGDFDLSAMGMGVIPATGKKIIWPEESSKWKLEGDKVISIQNLTSRGIGEFVAPLGVKPPSA